MGLFCCLIKEMAAIIIQTVNHGRADCNHFDNSSYVSCFFLSVDLNINNACLTISNFSDNAFHCDENNIAFLFLVIPNLFQGLSYLLVFMTALEFICAQAPLRLKGLLIGIWYALLATNYLFVGVPESIINNSLSWVIFHAIKVFLIFLFLIMYLCVSKRYRYRLRDEVVNEQFLVEEIYERRIDMAEQYEREDDDELTDLVESVQTVTSYGAMHT